MVDSLEPGEELALTRDVQTHVVGTTAVPTTAIVDSEDSIAGSERQQNRRSFDTS
jgi:hypothetical protein